MDAIMIELTRLNGKRFHLNPELVETIDSTPDTVITMTGGKTIMVRESVDQVVEKIFNYRGKILRFRISDLETNSGQINDTKVLQVDCHCEKTE